MSLIDKIPPLADALRAGREDYTLLALLRNADGGGRWDLVLAAPWLTGELSDYELVGKRMHEALSSDELSAIDRIAIIDPPNLTQTAFPDGIQTLTRIGAMRDFTFNGQLITEGHIFASSSARKPLRPTKKRTRVASR